MTSSSAEVVRIINSLYTGGAAAEGAGMPSVKVIADERTNSVLVSGETSQRLRLKALVAHLDTPLETGGDTQVRYLKYADSEKIAAKLREQIQGIVAAAQPAPGAGAGGAAAAPVVSSVGSGGDRNVSIWADAINADEDDDPTDPVEVDDVTVDEGTVTPSPTGTTTNTSTPTATPTP